MTGAVVRNDRIDGRAVVLLYLGGVASPLGRALTFRPGSGAFVDEETRTSGSIAGIATAGPLKGGRLTMLDHEHTYWFIWSAFRPDTAVRN